MVHWDQGNEASLLLITQEEGTVGTAMAKAAGFGQTP
jgi:hypothetical protein